MTDMICPVSRDEWNLWIKDRKQRREGTFQNEPGRLIADYNTEDRTQTSYHGRELLEMLQNADDAGTDHPEPAVLISVSAEGLCIANTGQVFSAPGVESLLLSNKSPKQLDRTRNIGYRGLGFRSVLNWTQSPFILSGGLALGFDRSEAEKWLRQLCQTNLPLEAEVTQFQQSNGILPVSILSAPAILDQDGTFAGISPGSATFAPVWQTAQQYRRDGYDTVIGLPFKAPAMLDSVIQQLDEIGMEVLLFTKNLRRLTIQKPDSQVTWTISRNEDRIEIQSDAPLSAPSCWRLFSEADDIEQRYLTDKQRATPGYEICVAIPYTGNGKRVLYSYFPTQAALPLPLIAHASVELTDNRQHLAEHDANGFIIGRLANLIVKAAVQCCSADDPWYALSLIAPQGDIDSQLDKMGFGKSLLAAARSAEIIPTRDGGWRNADQALLLPEQNSPLGVLPGYVDELDDTLELYQPERPKALESWLPVKGFESVVRPPVNHPINAFLKKLGLDRMDADDFRDTLNEIAPNLSLPERANLIHGLITSRLLPQDPSPNLLIDTEGALITETHEPFLSPEERSHLQVPLWVSIRLLHPQLVAELRTCFASGSARALVNRLHDFGVKEYAFGPLATAINKRADEISLREPDREAEYRQAALRSIYALYRGAGNAAVSLPDNLDLRLPNRSGGFALASNLYFGLEYKKGQLNEALLNPVGASFVAPCAALGLDETDAAVEAFLVWLGVATYPRAEEIEPSDEYTDWALSQLQFPAYFQGIRIDTLRELQNAHPYITSVTGIEYLDAMLACADPHVILAWVTTDPRFHQWEDGDAEAQLRIKQKSQRNFRALTEQMLPSLVLWKLRNQAWLPGPGGRKFAPSQLVTTRGSMSELQTVARRPAINYNYPLFAALKIGPAAVDHALERVGCRAGLDDLAWDDLYTLLLEMPQRDPDGREAQAFYRYLIEKEEAEPEESSAHAMFLANGQLWGKCGDKQGYYPISELRYADNQVLPVFVGQPVPLLALEKRRGAQKVLRRLGVSPLEKTSYNIEASVPHPQAAELSHSLDRLKPYIYALRRDASARTTSRKTIQALSVQLCSELTIDGQIIAPSHVSAGEALLDGNTAYLLAGHIERPEVLTNPTIAGAVGNLFTTLLRVEKSSEFAWLAQTRHPERMAVLANLLGCDLEEAEAKYEKARNELNIEEEIEPPTPAHVYVPEPDPAPSPTPPPAAPTATTGAQPATPKSAPNRVEVDPATSPVSARQPHQIKLRIQATPSSSTPHMSHQRIDPAYCQMIADRIEEEQDRFPLAVAHLQGTQAFGCDLLSFRSDEVRQRFKEQHDPALIDRFIEVKARSDNKAVVDLTGNEANAAFQYGERYFVYHISPGEGADEFLVSMLNDPLGSGHAISYVINPVRSGRATHWTVRCIAEI